MSIQKIDSYSAICDHCGEVLETSHEGFTIFVDEQVAQEEIDRADWYTEEGYEEPDLHYCKSCHWVDDNDEMHLRMERRKDTPDTNPADMPSRPVDEGPWIPVDEGNGVTGYVKASKEGDSQSMPKDIRVWVDTEVLRRNYDRQDVADAVRSMGMAMFYKLQQALSEMTSMRDLAKKEYDLTLKEVQTWKDECNTLSALLEGKNLENAGLKDEIAAYRKALEPGTSVVTQIEELEKYKKEEQK